MAHSHSTSLPQANGRAKYIGVSWHYVAKLWRDNDLKPHRQGTFKLSQYPRSAEKVADIVGLHRLTAPTVTGESWARPSR
jgi:hypothetical protein